LGFNLSPGAIKNTQYIIKKTAVAAFNLFVFTKCFTKTGLDQLFALLCLE
jgi:hypothetical protein